MVTLTILLAFAWFFLVMAHVAHLYLPVEESFAALFNLVVTQFLLAALAAFALTYDLTGRASVFSLLYFQIFIFSGVIIAFVWTVIFRTVKRIAKEKKRESRKKPANSTEHKPLETNRPVEENKSFAMKGLILVIEIIGFISAVLGIISFYRGH